MDERDNLPVLTFYMPRTSDEEKAMRAEIDAANAGAKTSSRGLGRAASTICGIDSPPRYSVPRVYKPRKAKG